MIDKIYPSVFLNREKDICSFVFRINHPDMIISCKEYSTNGIIKYKMLIGITNITETTITFLRSTYTLS